MFSKNFFSPPPRFEHFNDTPFDSWYHSCRAVVVNVSRIKQLLEEMIYISQQRHEKALSEIGACRIKLYGHRFVSQSFFSQNSKTNHNLWIWLSKPNLLPWFIVRRDRRNSCREKSCSFICIILEIAVAAVKLCPLTTRKRHKRVPPEIKKIHIKPPRANLYDFWLIFWQKFGLETAAELP